MFKFIFNFFTYLCVRLLGQNHLNANHIAFHGDQFEWWTLTKFGDGDDCHYYSTHKVNCSCCNYHRIAKRAWPKQLKVMGHTVGNNYEEAKHKATILNGM